jgi:hypothetical protein
MTIDERLSTIAQLLEATARVALRNEEAIKKSFELYELHQRSMITLVETTGHLGARVTALTEAVAGFVEESRAYVADSRERMKQIEANLDALIRIITAQHSNGKGSN